MWNQNYHTNELNEETETDIHIKSKLRVIKGERGGGGGINWEFGISIYMLLLLSRFSRVQFCATPQTAAHQAPLSMGFSRQEHWSGLPFPSPIYKLLYLNYINNKDLLHSSRNYVHYPIIDDNAKRIHVSKPRSLGCTPEANTL